ncbi:MAG: metallophosphoesterase [Chthoniobacterales bacterium]
MKPLFLFAGIFAASLLTEGARAQTGAGLPLLPQVPKTPALQDQPNATHFWFIAAGDNRPSDKRLQQPSTPSQIFKDAQKFKPAFFLWCGDTIYGHTSDEATLQTQYEGFFRIVPAKVPVFNAPGNHEMDTAQMVGNQYVETPDPGLRAAYLKFMKFPPNAPTYGAFDYGNSRFIAVDTEEVAASGSVRSPGKVVGNAGRTTTLDPGCVSQAQMDLLGQDLEANKAKAHIFVFMHHPIIPAKSDSGLNQADAAALQALFKKYPNVSYVIAAHEHLYFNATGTTLKPADRQDPSTAGPSYLVSGGAGAPLESCPGSAGSNCGSFNHYLVFEVDRDTVKVQVVQVSSTTGKKARR